MINRKLRKKEGCIEHKEHFYIFFKKKNDIVEISKKIKIKIKKNTFNT